MLKTFSGRRASQNEHELRSFIALLQGEGVSRYLEIGARHGDTFHEVMSNLPKGAMGVAADLPGGLWGTSSSIAALDKAVLDLQAHGYSVVSVIGDSQTAKVAQCIRGFGLYDAMLIDGDHTYVGVMRDWQLYRHMARMIAFHDIVGTGQTEKVGGRAVEVPKLWAQLREDYPHVEFIDADSKMGIGVLWTSP